MTLQRFNPQTIDEAIELCSRYRDKAVLMGGGTDLVVQIKKKTLSPEILISLEKVKELGFIRFDQKNGVTIGAMATVEAIEKSELIRKEAGVLSAAAATLGNPLIRKSATIGGNLCNASPSADLAPACLVLDVRLEISGANGNKSIPVHEFFTGPRTSVLASDELLTRIVVPIQPRHTGAVYLKSTRSKGADLALVGVAVRTTVMDDTIRDIRIALGAVAPTPIRARQAEDAIRGRKIDDPALEECCGLACSEASCISDVRCEADYREALIPILIRRAMRQSIDMARQ
jgi:aerobic carbon-monoxide dehydrogenase medium subunit